ncbi:aldehyde dehydrogenase family protein, partial [bacterium]
NAEKKHFEQAIEVSLSVLEQTKKQSRYKRSEILRKICVLIEARKDEFIQLIIDEAGKPITYAKSEVDRAIATFKIASEEVLRFGGEFLPLDITAATEGYNSITARFPIGVIAGISPFNFPLNLTAHKVAPAIATGNPLILKPPHQAPSASLLLGEICLEAGIIPGSLNVLPGMPEQADILITDPRIKMVSFTGSAKVGWDIKNRCGKKKVCLELGGNAAVIVDKDTDLEVAIARIANGGYSYAGQVCISVQRIIIQEDIYQDFSEKFVDYVKNKIKLGDPNEASTVVGPLINIDAAERTEKWLAEAVNQGANILTGATREGKMFAPTVLDNVDKNSKINCEEVFAPVTILSKYKTFEEAVNIVNDSDFGLQTGVFTRDIKKIFYSHENIEAGGVIINDYPTFRVDNMPYGGIKDSGFGREGIKYAMEDMTELKVTVFNLNNLSM